MTTIALDSSGLIAYDSRECCGSTIVDDNCDKRVSQNGLHYFFCGRTADQDLLIEAVEGIARETYHEAVDIHAIVILGKEIYTAGISKEEGYYWQQERKGNPVTRGSGSDHALTALDCGCNAKEAVKYAMKRDNNTGGKIRTFQV